MRFLMSDVLIAEIWLNFLKMTSQEFVPNVKKRFKMTERTTGVSNGVHLHPLMQEIFALNSENPNPNFTDIPINLIDF